MRTRILSVGTKVLAPVGGRICKGHNTMRPGVIMRRRSGVIAKHEPACPDMDTHWEVSPATMPTRDQLGCYMVRINDSKGLVVFAHDTEIVEAHP